MRKTLVVTAVLLMFALAVPAFSNELELGMSWTPLPGADESTEELDSITGFHVGYSFFRILYASWDSLVMPPFIIREWTGYNRPGFLNLYDAGIRLVLGPVLGYATVGVNNVYVYKQEELPSFEDAVGVNLRLGLGLKFNWWGVNVSGTAVFPNFDYMTSTLQGLVPEETRDIALQKIADVLVPSLNFAVYF
jgi:hypothetical protein